MPLDINCKDPNGFTPLLLLCYKGSNGLKVNANSEGTFRNRLACAEILIQNKADINCQGDGIFMTPLHWAAYHNDVDVLKLLLNSGAKPKLNKSGRAPIDLAGFCGHKAAIKVLVDDCETKGIKQFQSDSLNGVHVVSKSDVKTVKTPYRIDKKIRPDET